MFNLSYVATREGHDVLAFNYQQVELLKSKGYLIRPIYTEIERELPRKTRDEYRKQVLAIQSGKRYDPVWNHRKETVKKSA